MSALAYRSHVVRMLQYVRVDRTVLVTIGTRLRVSRRAFKENYAGCCIVTCQWD